MTAEELAAEVARLRAELAEEREERKRLARLLELSMTPKPRSGSAAYMQEPALELQPDIDVKVRLLTEEERAQRQAEADARAAQYRAEEALRRERIKGKPHVYFIQQGDSGAIKIGCSKNPTQRLQGLQTGHSEPLRLLTCAMGSQAQERALHDRFAHLRVSGEWFRPAEDLLAYIRLVNDRRAL